MIIVALIVLLLLMPGCRVESLSPAVVTSPRSADRLGSSSAAPSTENKTSDTVTT